MADIVVEEAAKLLGLTPPVTSNQIKRAYSIKALLEHPDHSKHPDAAARFQRLTEAKKLLERSPSVLGDFSNTALKTVDGQLLSELGNGLGPHTNGTTCGECSGKGFYSASNAEFISCPDCRDAVFGWLYRCVKCRGSGDFTKNGKAVGRCFNCTGSGWVSGGFRNTCRSCNGLLQIRAPSGPPKNHFKCSRCKGTGELAMWNPVLAKGLLSPR